MQIRFATKLLPVLSLQFCGLLAAQEPIRLSGGTTSTPAADCTLQIATVSLAVGVVGVAYSQPLGAFGCPGPLTWTVTSGFLPPGLTLNPQSGVIAGVPTAVVNASFTVRARHASGAEAASTLTLEVRFCAPEVATLFVPVGIMGQPYFHQLVVAGCPLPFTWRVSAGALPAGLTLNPGTGVISGAPTELITTTFTVTAQHLGLFEASRTYTLIVINCSLRFLTPALSDGAIGQPYSDALWTSNCTPVTMSITVGSLPPGLQLDPDTGAISGTPSAVGTWTFTVTALHRETGISASADYSIRIGAGCQITTSAPPNGTVGEPYTHTLEVAGCRSPLTWSVSTGALPAGLTLNRQTGTISGTPTAMGRFVFALTAEEPAGARVTKTITLVIEAAPPLRITPSSLQFTATAGTPVSSVQNILIGASGATAARASVQSAPPWLRLSSMAASIPGLIQTSVDAAILATGVYRGQIQIASGASAAVIPVTLTVTSRSAPLALESSLILLTAVEGSAVPVSRSAAFVSDGGAGAMLSITVDDPEFSPWLAVARSTEQNQSAVTVTANPTGLRHGTYRGAIRLQSSEQNTTAGVILQVLPRAPILDLDFDRVTFRMAAGAAGPQAQTVRVLNRGAGLLNWSARIAEISGGDWLSISPSSGVSDAADPAGSSTLTFSIRTAGLSAPATQGCRDARVQLSTADGDVSRFVIVTLCVTAASAEYLQPSRAEQPGAFFADTFVVTADRSAALATRSFSVASTSVTSVPVAVASAVTSEASANWLTVSASAASASASQPVQFTWTASAAGLPVGVYRGAIAFQAGASPVKSTEVSLIVVDRSRPCVPRRAVMVQTGLEANFQRPARTVVPLAVRVLDDCGNPVDNAALQMTAGGPGSAPVSIDLRGSGNGFYTGQWQPQSQGAVDVVFRVIAPGLAGEQKRLAGTAGPPIDPAAPVLTALVNAASFLATAVAPGSIVTAFGSNLLSRSGLNAGFAASFIPLPAELGGTQLWIGGHSAPLYFVNQTQINFQVPFRVPVDRPTQVMLRGGDRFAGLPDLAPVQAVDPAIFNLQVARAATPRGSACPSALAGEYLGPAAALNSDDASFAQPNNLIAGAVSRPAAPEKAISLFVNGLGEVTPPISSGVNSVEANGETVLRHVAAPPRVYIGGQPARVLFAGLSPLLVGVYQLNVVVPEGTAGERVPVQVEAGGVCSPAGLTIAVR
ncbi:MAG TPA: putative Ig domain-containing protein [Bryobacteraceae bacterium]|nr:putative Ig domain-containing protein [Bryobacteraceae bacterium]